MEILKSFNLYLFGITKWLSWFFLKCILLVIEILNFLLFLFLNLMELIFISDNLFSYENNYYYLNLNVFILNYMVLEINFYHFHFQLCLSNYFYFILPFLKLGEKKSWFFLNNFDFIFFWFVFFINYFLILLNFI